jgi:hypothetical protein
VFTGPPRVGWRTTGAKDMPVKAAATGTHGSWYHAGALPRRAMTVHRRIATNHH